MIHSSLLRRRLHRLLKPRPRTSPSPRPLSSLATAPPPSHDRLLSRIFPLLLSNSPHLDSLTSRLSERVVLDVLHSVGADWPSALRFFRWAPPSGHRHGAAAYTKMVDLLGRARQFDRMWSLVREMRREGLTSPGTFATVARRLVRAGRWEEAVRAFHGLEAIGLRKDRATLHALLDALCKKGKVEIARELVRFHASQFPPDARTLAILVHGWCVVGQTDAAERAVAEMKARGVPPCAVTYSTILHAHCRRLDFPRAFELMDRMVGEGCGPSVVAYTSVIHALAKSGNADAVSRIVERMGSDGCEPDVPFYNTLISALGRAGRVREAYRVLEVEMPESGVSPHLSTYNTLISVLCRNGEVKMAFDVLRMVENSEWKPDAHTFNPLLKFCVRTGDPGDGVLCGLLSNMVSKYHVGLDSTTYALLVRGLCRAGKCEAAFLVFEGMARRGILPMDVYTYDFLAAEAERNGLSDTVDWLRALKRKFKGFYH